MEVKDRCDDRPRCWFCARVGKLSIATHGVEDPSKFPTCDHCYNLLAQVQANETIVRDFLWHLEQHRNKDRKRVQCNNCGRESFADQWRKPTSSDWAFGWGLLCPYCGE